MAHPLRGKPRIPRIYLFDEVDAFPIARDGCPSVPPWSDSHREHPNAAVSPSRSALPPPGGCLGPSRAHLLRGELRTPTSPQLRPPKSG